MFGADVIDLLTFARIIGQFVAAHVIADFFPIAVELRQFCVYDAAQGCAVSGFVVFGFIILSC